MANKVYANSMELACKAGNGKSICAFPDVCMTPPQTPATPPGVPIPYPNTGMDSDTTGGSSTVKVSNQETMLKDKSSFKKSTGDEAGAAPMKGVITHKNMGKVYFNAWSMDVKIEGENVVRNLDLTTHNHASKPGQTPPWPFMASMAVDAAGNSEDPCQKDKEKEEKACKEYSPNKKNGPDACAAADKSLANGLKPRAAEDADAYSKQIMANDCLKARRCKLQKYKDTENGTPGCCAGQTGHHLVEASSFMIDRTGKNSKNPGTLQQTEYKPEDAPCICLEGTNQYHGTHGMMHTFQSTAAIDTATPGTLSFVRADGSIVENSFEKTTNYGTAKAQGAAAVEKVFPGQCTAECITAQLDDYHKKCGIDDSTKCKSVITGRTGDEWVQKAQSKAQDLMGKTSGSF